MKGIIFNAVEESIVGHLGGEGWDRLLQAAGLEGAYTALGNYDDGELLSLVEAGSLALGLDVPDTLRALGRDAAEVLVTRHPSLVEEHRSSRTVFHRLDDTIHPQVLAIHPDAVPPTFTARDRGSDEIVLEYQSRRRLCHLAEGLAVGTAAHWDEEIVVTQEQCMLLGADSCHIVLRYEPIDD